MDGMTDREKDIIAVVWNDLALRKKLETDPYSLSKSDLKLLELNDEFNKRFVEINDEIQISTRRQAFKAYLQ
jgi:vacuolar-type H+-ATPase subunit B/Vma2